MEEETSLYYKKQSLKCMTKAKKKELGNLAVWSLNSAKQGNGIHQLRDDNYETFWQSDGPIPHVVNIQFQKKTKVSDIAIHLDIKTDESYTPEIISVLGGIHMQDLKEICEINLKEPVGWVIIPLKTKGRNGERDFIYSMNFQIRIKQMFHSGKDTHVRLIKIFGYDGMKERDKEREVFGFNNYTLR